MQGSELRAIIKELILEVIQEQQATQNKLPNVQGVVSSLDSDGTVTVTTNFGLTLTGVRTPRKLIKNDIVLVITTVDGIQVAL